MRLRERKIRAAAERHGIKLDEVRWEPIGGSMEMCGPSGGWVAFEEGDGGYTFVGYHFKEVIERIEEFATERSEFKKYSDERASTEI